MFPLNLENQRKSCALHIVNGFHSTPISVLVCEEQLEMYCTPDLWPCSGCMCVILGNVVLSVSTCNRVDENDVFFFYLFLTARESLCAILLFVE